VEPRVVFGGLDSGVANTGTFLDEVWAAAPFRSKGAFIAHVSAVAAKFYTAADRARVVLAARHARMV
jgi:hypothetical protein